jgi:transcriptional regulator with XRE-family HTH domain
MKGFGNRVSKIRSDKDLTQTEVADKMGISLNTYKQLEYKTENPKLDTIISLLGVLEATLDDLFPELCNKTQSLSKTESKLFGNFHQLRPDQQEAVLKLIESFV